MAQRRMFSLKIVDSAKFLKMPSSTRLLYYDLCMRADDDGVVEGFNVLRMTGASEDDLKILVAKDFLKVLNEDLVSYVTDWKEHNKIRADRKVDSIYKNLLLQVLPNVKLIEPKQRADLKKKNKDCTSNESNWTSNGQSKDGLGEDRIGKDSLGKDKIGQDSSSSINFSNEEIFKHYEKCGFISTPILLETISADVEVYGSKNMMDAATESMKRGKINNYNYVLGILQNWQTEGRKEDKNGTTSEFTKNTESEEQNYNFNF